MKQMKLYSQVVGVLFLAIGVLSLIPGVVSSDGLLLGIFQVNPFTQTLIHLATGVLALLAVYSAKDYYLATYVKVFAVVYALVAVWGLPALMGGLTGSSNVLFGLIHVNLPTELLHVAVAVAGLYVGFTSKAGVSAKA